MIQRIDPFWQWMLHTFGVSGTIVGLFVALVVLLAWLITPLGVWFLYCRGRKIEQLVTELHERTASTSRQQIAERLKRDPSRRRSRRRS